jgi:hypothetical protein
VGYSERPGTRLRAEMERISHCTTNRINKVLMTIAPAYSSRAKWSDALGAQFSHAKIEADEGDKIRQVTPLHGLTSDQAPHG